MRCCSRSLIEFPMGQGPCSRHNRRAFAGTAGVVDYLNFCVGKSAVVNGYFVQLAGKIRRAIDSDANTVSSYQINRVADTGNSWRSSSAVQNAVDMEGSTGALSDQCHVVKSSIVDLPRRNKTVLVASNIILLKHGVQFTGPDAWTADPDGKHACMPANRPFFNHRLDPRRGRSDPEIDREIIRVEIADGIAESDLAVGSIEGKRLPHLAV